MVVGLDIGQRRDYSAVAVLEYREDTDGTRDPVTYDFKRVRSVCLRHTERIRIGSPFGAVVDRVRWMFNDHRLRNGSLVVDATGVGAPVVELLREARLPCRLVPVQITGGLDENSDGTYYRVPKRDLVVGLQVLMDQWPFEIMEGTPAVQALIKELANFKAKRSQSGAMRYEAPKDDLIMALSLAWWWTRKTIPRR